MQKKAWRGTTHHLSFRLHPLYSLGVGQSKSHNESSRLRNSPNQVLAIIVGVVIIAVVVVMVFSTTRSVVRLNPGTPQGTVQAYLSAVFEGQNLKAAELLAPESGCKVQDLDRAYVIKNARVDLVKTEIDGESAQVWVRVEIPTSGPFESFMTEDHTFRLNHINQGWLLTGIPWPLYNCGVMPK